MSRRGWPEGDHTTRILPGGKQIWLNSDNELDRGGDEPAVIHRDGTREWWRNGVPWRVGGRPMVIDCNGTQKWLRGDVLHRGCGSCAACAGGFPCEDDLPAVVYGDGSEAWWHHGKRHRGGGKPAYVDADGSELWYEHDLLHRTCGGECNGADPSICTCDLPAIENSNGTRKWYHLGVKLRVVKVDGTEKIYADGKCVKVTHPSAGKEDEEDKEE
jgi:hypothetical protein